MIVLERFESMGPWGLSYGKSSLLERQIYSDRIQDLPWLISPNSIEDQILSRKLDGKISKELTGESLRKTGLIKTGPLETRFATRVMQIALDQYDKTILSRTDRNDLNLICAVEPQASITGYRNGLRLGYDFEKEFEESQFVNNLDLIFKDVHPMMSLHNMPNQMTGSLAINFGLGGETINIAGRESSFEALRSAIRLVKTGKNQKVILLGAFCYRPSIVSNVLPMIAASSFESIKRNLPVLNEWVGVSCVRKSNKPRKGNMAIRGLYSYTFDSINSLRSIFSEAVKTFFRSVRVQLSEVDLVVINDPTSGWFADTVMNIQSYNYRMQFVDLYQRVGYSYHCSFLQSLEFAQMIFSKGLIPGKLRRNYRDSMYFSGVQRDPELFNGRFILLVGLGFPNQIQLTLLDGVASE